MEILVGLAIAAVVVYGWACGFVIVAIFLTLPQVIVLLITIFRTDIAGAPTAFLVEIALLAATWAPVAIRRRLGAL